MARRRRPLSDKEKTALLEQLRAFRDDVLTPHAVRVPPGSPDYWKANAVNAALLEWADHLAGEKDVLLSPSHSQPPS